MDELAVARGRLDMSLHFVGEAFIVGGEIYVEDPYIHM